MKLFTSATIKLAGWYLCILMIVSLLFSSIIFQVARSEVDSQINKIIIQHNKLLHTPIAATEHTSTSTSNLLVSLGYINLIVLLAGGACSYLLARVTLHPIELAHKAQSRFVSNASHQLRTPLAIMKAEAELALQTPATSKKELQETLRSNLEEVNKLTELTTMLLELSRTEKILSLEAKSFDIVALLHDIAQDRHAHRRTIINAPEHHSTVTLHQAATRELCAILLDNSLKHSPPKSPVIIDLSFSKQTVTIRFTNSGAISTRILPHVFEQFFRGGQHTKGYGLGLPLAEQLTAALGGTITVSSVKQQTIVTIVLPIS